jgi:hypothetical protein
MNGASDVAQEVQRESGPQNVFISPDGSAIHNRNWIDIDARLRGGYL